MVSAVETQKLSSDDQETKAGKQSDCEEQQEQQQGNEVSEKFVLKKPDKILPCPRCNSMDTKFCYYNNYNVNQPRHFCKKCQRYWTAGGTMRNVPVGAVRRKNKNSAAAAHYHHLTCMSDPIPVGLIHHHHSTNFNPTANGSGNIRTDLSFGSDTPLCDSMASVLKLGGKTVMNSGFPYPAEQIEEQSTGLSLTASNSNSADERTGTNLQERAIKNCQMFTPQVPPYINGSPWPYPWTPAHHAADMVFSASSFAVPFYPAAPYRGCSTWSTPWPSPLPSPSPTSGSTGSGPNSPTLGKHSREGDILNNQDKGDSISVKKCSSGSSDQEKCLWIPKTLRIHDPEAASKSSFWASMGFKNDDKSDALGGRRVLFKPFQTKAEPTHHKPDTSQLFYTNPAAMSRSINFQETS